MPGRCDMRTTRDKCRLAAVGALALSLLVSACAQSSVDIPALPTLVKDDRQFLTKEQQAKAIADMARDKDAAKAQAEKQIERR